MESVNLECLIVKVLIFCLYYIVVASKTVIILSVNVYNKSKEQYKKINGLSQG